MHKFKRVALAVFVLFLILMVVAFTLENRQPASLVFLGWSTVQMPIAAYVILALLVGMVVGPMVAWLLGRKAGRGH
ncbi:lipopolysaccharide assembly protein LapA domain-containing protein [Pseudomonas sp. Ant30-3]|uniref:lipopolysaccharide assembly protein LapA domain-containing protein n=1 Tax=Pseudomonas sp. Ant30-3 TaxID=1488328 RepID=UPI00048AC7CE|nr:lipopolysaccharide assembly protein LapA domain-containing protein [Pseudomonas sp. Ant30-3]